MPEQPQQQPDRQPQQQPRHGWLITYAVGVSVFVAVMAWQRPVARPSADPSTGPVTSGAPSGKPSPASLATPIKRVTSATPSLRIDVNHASAADLQLLPGIGPGLAQRIIAHRETEGPFVEPDDLTEVKGIGARTLEKVRDYVMCGNVE